MARARRPALWRRARLARCRRDCTSRPAARTRTLPVELTPHYFSLPHRPSLPHCSVARIETDAPTLPPPPAYPATLLPLPILLPDPRRLPRHNQSLRRPGLEPVILPSPGRQAPWRPWQHHGAPASNPCDVPPSKPTISNSTHSLCCRYLHSPSIPSTTSAATSTPPLRLLPPTARMYHPKVPKLRNLPRSCPQVCRPIDCGPNPSCPRRCDSNPPAHAQASGEGRTRGRHMAPTHSVRHPRAH